MGYASLSILYPLAFPTLRRLYPPSTPSPINPPPLHNPPAISPYPLRISPFTYPLYLLYPPSIPLYPPSIPHSRKYPTKFLWLADLVLRHRATSTSFQGSFSFPLKFGRLWRKRKSKIESNVVNPWGDKSLTPPCINIHSTRVTQLIKTR